jgi:glycerol-3-phosphate dehydrogenase (NAD(P)+)
MTFERIAVLGAGSWGTALAHAALRAGRDVVLWSRDAKAAQAMAATRSNPLLPDVAIDQRIAITSSLADALKADAILAAVPAQSLRALASLIAPSLAENIPVISCAKGIERGTHKFMTQIIAEAAPRATPAILSGPSFAADVARGLPTAVTLSAADETIAADLAKALGSATFRPYHTTDLRGVEVGGAAKNVLAIATGIVSGRGLGASAAAALVTRGFAELVRFGRKLDARPETLTGLSGLGDLVLTCSSPQSRNYSLGLSLGKGMTPAEAEKSVKLAEGAFTASVLSEMAKEFGVDMPITAAVAAVLDGTMSVDDAIASLMTRPFRAE